MRKGSERRTPAEGPPSHPLLVPDHRQEQKGPLGGDRDPAALRPAPQHHHAQGRECLRAPAMSLALGAFLCCCPRPCGSGGSLPGGWPAVLGAQEPEPETAAVPRAPQGGPAAGEPELLFIRPVDSSPPKAHGAREREEGWLGRRLTCAVSRCPGGWGSDLRSKSGAPPGFLLSLSSDPWGSSRVTGAPSAPTASSLQLRTRSLPGRRSLALFSPMGLVRATGTGAGSSPRQSCSHSQGSTETPGSGRDLPCPLQGAREGDGVVCTLSLPRSTTTGSACTW